MQPFGREFVAIVDRPPRTTAVDITTFSAAWAKVKFQGRPVGGLESRRRLLWVESASSATAEAVTDDRPRRPAIRDRFVDAADVQILRTSTSAFGNTAVQLPDAADSNQTQFQTLGRQGRRHAYARECEFLPLLTPTEN